MSCSATATPSQDSHSQISPLTVVVSTAATATVAHQQLKQQKTTIPATRNLSVMVHPSEKITADEKLKMICFNEVKSECYLNKSNSVVHSYRKGNDNLLKTKLKSKRVVRKPVEVSSNETDKCSEIRKPVYGIKTRRKSKSRVKVNTMAATSLSESASLVGKFVLPSRSLHSSRVIKPNKKFINSELRNVKNECTNSKPYLKTRQTRTSSEKVTRGVAEKREADVVNTVYSKKSERAVQSSSGPATGNQHLGEQLQTAGEDNANIMDSGAQGSGSGWQCGGKLVLRKARLQLHSQTGTEGRSTDGPFSSYVAHTSATNPGPPGTVTCGVCGAVRFYRFVKQARKFNIYSCESCRKFISKMIKRQSCSKNISVPSLVCHKGQGKCTPILSVLCW